MKKFTLLFILFTFISTIATSQTRFVKIGGNGNGTSWANAYGTIQEALNNAASGTIIWVAQGTYYPVACSPCDNSHRPIKFEIPQGVALYGGFNGTESTINQRAWEANITILSGDIDQDGTLDGNAYTVVYTENVTAATTVDGFTIENGNSNSFGDIDARGGGWYNKGSGNGNDSSPTIRNCIFSGNQSTSRGGAIYNKGSSGGACHSLIENCSFINNESKDGGAVYNYSMNGNCSPTIKDCLFDQNDATFGAGIYNDGNGGISNPDIINCIIKNNTVSLYGAGIFNFGKTNGGTCNPNIVNCLITGNTASAAAAGIYNLASNEGTCNTQIVNCTFSQNNANVGGAVYFNATNNGIGEITISNSIFWNSQAGFDPVFHFSGNANPTINVDHCLVDAANCASIMFSGNNGTLNCGTSMVFNQNPQFVNSSNDNFHLLTNSPAIDVGNNTPINNLGITEDLDEQVRIQDGTIELGCYEYSSGNPPPVLTLNNCPANINVSAPPGANSMIVNWVEPTASSTCTMGSVNLSQTNGSISGSSFNIGTTNITYQATDGCENIKTCNFTVTVQSSSTSLNISCPQNISVIAPNGSTTATVSWNDATANSNCPTGNVLVNQIAGASSGSNFPIGATTITYEATDNCGNTETCSFIITVSGGGTGNYCTSKGNQPWTEWIANVNLESIDNTSLKDGYADYTNISTDLNLGGTHTINLTTGYSWFAYGQYWRIWIDYDQDGFFQEPEEIAFSANLPAQPNGTLTDLATGSINIPASAMTGSTRMRISMKRTAYASPCETFDFGEVEDYTVNLVNAGPILTLSNCPSNISVTAAPGASTAVANWTIPTASSTCTTGSVSLNQTAGAASASAFPIGITTISYEATDACGNTEICSFTVNVQSSDATLTLSCPNNISVTADPGASNAIATWTAPTANSTCTTGSVSINQTVGATSGSSFPIGMTTISYEASDGCGNTEICSFIINIQSSNATLTLSCPNNISVTAAAGASTAVANWTTPTVNSTCTTGSVSVNQTAGAASGSSFSIGTTIISYEATDGCGNLENCSFTITVSADNGPGNYCDSKGEQPWVQWIDHVTFGSIDNTSFKEQYADFTSQSTDVSTGETYTIELSNGFSWFTFEEHWRVWIDYNQDGIFQEPNEIAYSKIVAAPPVGTNTFANTGDITIPATALIGSTRMRVSVKNGGYASPCETFTLGEVEDYTVNISQGGPILSLTCPNNISLTTTPGQTTAVATWTAPTGNTTCPTGSISLSQTAGTTSGSSFPIGTTTISYQATDNCGNTKTCSFTITVNNGNGVLTLNCPNNITQTAAPGTTSAVVNWTAPTGSTTCPTGSVSVSQTTGATNGSSFPIGTTTITYQATDNCGNLETCSFTVIVEEGQSGTCNINFTTTGTSITITGLNPGSGHTIAKVFSPAWATIYNCLDDCDDPLVLTGLTAGTYHFSYNLYDSNWQPICDDLIDIQITGVAPSITSDSEFLFLFAEKSGRETVINWTSNTGFKNDYFELERSYNGEDFEMITMLQNESDDHAPIYYSHKDKEPKQGKNFYRLKQFYKDGTFQYSQIKEISFELDLDDLVLFPNPTHDEIFINLKQFEGQPCLLQLCNSLGKVEETKIFEETPVYPVRFDLKNQSGGFYFIRVKVAKRKQQTLKFVINKL